MSNRKKRVMLGLSVLIASSGLPLTIEAKPSKDQAAQNKIPSKSALVKEMAIPGIVGVACGLSGHYLPELALLDLASLWVGVLGTSVRLLWGPDYESVLQPASFLLGFALTR